MPQRSDPSPRNQPGLLFWACLLFPSIIQSFPTYHDPFTAEPPLVLPGKLLCTLPLITDGACDSYDKVITQKYYPPQHDKAACPCVQGRIAKAVLDIYGAVQGVQFDRVGALFLGGVELIRTTTPEPSKKGIHWHVTKDVSEYLRVLLSPADATLTIPNVVDKTYTGIIYINATISFYGYNHHDTIKPISPSMPQLLLNETSKWLRSDLPLPLDPPLIIPLSNPPSMGNIWSSMTVNGNQSMDFHIEWPQTNIGRAYLDIYASPHQCEEFWYTNIPTDEQEAFPGFCGGGTYREIQAHINGRLAGAAYPFVVLYTGGVNPLLWRPLTGIMSFNVPAYRLDLAPFLGELNTKATTTISVSITGANDKGLWYIDGALVLYPDPDHATSVVLGGEVSRHEDTGAKWEVTKEVRGAEFSYLTNGHHNYTIEGFMVYPNGSKVMSVVKGHLEAWNSNFLNNITNTQVTAGAMWSERTLDKVNGDGDGSTSPADRRTDRYPYRLESTYAQDNSTMEITAVVDLVLQGASYYGLEGQQSISWDNHIASHAVYNRSLDRKADRAYIMRAQSKEGYDITHSLQGTEPCYHREVAAHYGWPTKNSQTYTCIFPPGMSFCAYHPCPELISGAEVATLAHSPITSFDHNYEEHPAIDVLRLMTDRGSYGGGGGGDDDDDDDDVLLTRSPTMVFANRGRNKVPGGFHAGTALKAATSTSYGPSRLRSRSPSSKRN